LRADQIQSVNGGGEKEYLVPIIADAEAGFGEI
jgi:isocitrate lyase